MADQQPLEDLVVALSALDAFASALQPMGVPPSNWKSIVNLAWETARRGTPPLDGTSPDEDIATALLTAEEAALAEVGAIAVAGALESAAARNGRPSPAATVSGSRLLSGQRKVWSWLCWRVDACARAAAYAGTPPERCRELRRLGEALLEPYRPSLENVQAQQERKTSPRDEVASSTVPTTLHVEAPPCAQAAGEYCVVSGTLIGGFPIWKLRGGGYWLFHGTNGHWFVGDTSERDKSFNCASGLIASHDPHYRSMPDFAQGGHWVICEGNISDSSIKVRTLDYEKIVSNRIESCASCGAAMAKDSRFCRMCGQKRDMDPYTTCQCGNTFKDDARFCSKCGKQRPEQLNPQSSNVTVGQGSLPVNGSLSRSDVDGDALGPPDRSGNDAPVQATSSITAGNLPRASATTGETITVAEAAGAVIGDTPIENSPGGRCSGNAPRASAEVDPERCKQLVKLFEAFDVDNAGLVNLRRAFELRQARQRLGEQVWPEQETAAMRESLEASGLHAGINQDQFVEFFDKRLPRQPEEFEDVCGKFMDVARKFKEDARERKQERRVGVEGLFDALDVDDAGAIDGKSLALLAASKISFRPSRWTSQDTVNFFQDLGSGSGGKATRTEFVDFAEVKLPSDMNLFWEAISRLTEVGTLAKQQSANEAIARAVSGKHAAYEGRGLWLLPEQNASNDKWIGPLSARDVLTRIQHQEFVCLQVKELELETLVCGLEGAANQSPSRSEAQPLYESLAAIGTLARKESEGKARKVVSDKISAKMSTS